MQHSKLAERGKGSTQRAAVVGMLAIKQELIDKNPDQERLIRWTAQSIEVLLECELARIDAAV